MASWQSAYRDERKSFSGRPGGELLAGIFEVVLEIV
jgi:hypothetical protein